MDSVYFHSTVLANIDRQIIFIDLMMQNSNLCLSKNMIYNKYNFFRQFLKTEILY